MAKYPTINVTPSTKEINDLILDKQTELKKKSGTIVSKGNAILALLKAVKEKGLQ
jgi:hypothetical protein